MTPANANGSRILLMMHLGFLALIAAVLGVITVHWGEQVVHAWRTSGWFAMPIVLLGMERAGVTTSILAILSGPVFIYLALVLVPNEIRIVRLLGWVYLASLLGSVLAFAAEPAPAVAQFFVACMLALLLMMSCATWAMNREMRIALPTAGLLLWLTHWLLLSGLALTL